ncbi:MAG: hypothetical protein ACD_61C00007G0017 [uncultured bacterium]|nr:MAG: hypothetical protein ACD_61C00007G0017 [uncultured bacterium]
MVYWDIVRFSFLRFFAYPYEILAKTAERVIEVIFLIMFWSLYSKSSNQAVSVPQISAYFLIAMGVADLTMSRWGALSNLIGNMVKSGQISNYMIKPVNLVWALYAISLGRNGLRVMLAIINILLGLIIFPPQGILQIGMFVVMLILSWFISFAYNLFEGILFLHFTDAVGIRNSIQNFIRVFTGAMVPIYLFPSPLKEIVLYLPFPAMIYGPASAFSIQTFDYSVIRQILIALFWAVFLNIAMRKWWHYSMKKYEAVGI